MRGFREAWSLPEVTQLHDSRLAAGFYLIASPMPLLGKPGDGLGEAQGHEDRSQAPPTPNSAANCALPMAEQPLFPKGQSCWGSC